MRLICYIFFAFFLTTITVPVSTGAPTCNASDKYQGETIHAAFGDSIIRFRQALISGDRERSSLLLKYIESVIAGKRITDSLLISDAYYYCGYNAILNTDYKLSADYYLKSVQVREALNVKDITYRNGLTNIGTSLFQLGRFSEAVILYDSLISFVNLQDGYPARQNLTNYINLASCYNELKQYDEAIAAAYAGIEVANHHANQEDMVDLAMLYNNLGISFSRQNDYTRANLHMTRAYEIMKPQPLINTSLFINIINSLTVINARLGNDHVAESYYREALPVAFDNPGESSFLLIGNYSIFLAEKGNTEEADRIMTDIVQRLMAVYGSSARFRYEILEKQAGFLVRFNIDPARALRIVREALLPYCSDNPGDHILNRDIKHTYALALLRSGHPYDALNAIQEALFINLQGDEVPEIENPGSDSFITDRSGLGLLNDKIGILRTIFQVTGDTAFLGHAIETNRMLISAIETVRIDISEEESRILLGDNFRKAYDGMVSDLYSLYSISGKENHFRLAFEYAERGKAAGLLVSMREIKATQFLIPDSLSIMERDLDRKLGLTREKIALEMSQGTADEEQLKILKATEYELSEQRAELIRHFERNYPEYYTAKYNTSVAGVEDVRKLSGRGSTYINYIYADSAIYVFVVNNRYKSLVRVPLEPEFQDIITEFRRLVLLPAQAGNIREIFERYSYTGSYLYGKLIEPINNLLTTEKLIISPDNILTYIPFEALLKSYQKREDLLYRELDFLLKDFRISYTYSATMYIESSGRNQSFRNPALAFAPRYSGGINRDSILITRQVRQEMLFDLPYAREEASYVRNKLGGEVWLNEEARESVYKARAQLFPVIHLAMHTVINDQSPGYSRMIFTNSRDGDEDGYLNTYEIYGIPVSARMVVVSSCNTGTGQLRAGEGVMSLARGFINAGSQSVVMSLWEVDDIWGTNLMKVFYDNLTTGMTKSSALQKAKLDVIRNSEQFLGHPYYWATLVIYGNPEAIFYDNRLLAAYLMIVLIVIAVAVRAIFYFRSR